MCYSKVRTVLFNPRMLVMLCMGFASGLPLALTGSTLQAWFTQAGISVVAIGALSLIGMPYVWKFVWAPIMDRFAPLKGGRHRGWIFLTQLALGIAIALLSLFDPAVQPGTISVLALLIAFFSASQDIAIDAYRTDILLPDERGVGTAYFVFAYRMAMFVSGGIALVFADYYGWRVMYQVVAALYILSLTVTYFAQDPKESFSPPSNILNLVKTSFLDLLQRPTIGLILLFIIFYKLGDALAASLMSNFLLHGLGFSLTTVGVAYKTVSLLATLLGAFIGGSLLIGLGLYRSLWIFGIAQGISTLLFMALALVGKQFGIMLLAVFGENFCSAMGTTALVAFMMSLCNQRFSATQFACLSALSAIARVFVGPFAGMLVAQQGWVSFYGWSFLLSFPGLFLLWLIHKRMGFNVERVKN